MRDVVWETIFEPPLVFIVQREQDLLAGQLLYSRSYGGYNVRPNGGTFAEIEP